MARKKRGRKSAKRVAAGKKAARTRARRRRGGRKRRSIKQTLRINRRSRRTSGRRRSRRRTRRNPKFTLKRAFNQRAIMRGLAILVGFTGGVALPGLIMPVVPKDMDTKARDVIRKLMGIPVVMIGGWVSMQGRKKDTKNVGTGLIVAGVYDLLASWLPPEMSKFIPQVSPPIFKAATTSTETETASGYFMGSSINRSGRVEIVGANINSYQEPEIVGEDMDIVDSIEEFA